MSVASSRYSSSAQDFSRCPTSYIPLSKNGSIVRNLRVEVEYSYKIIKKTVNPLDAIILKVMGVFECFCHCPRRYVTRRDRAVIQLSSIGASEEYENFIARLSHKNPTQFEILDTNYSEQMPLCPTDSKDLIGEIESVLSRNGMSCSKEDLSRLLTARAQAELFKEETPGHMVCVSSKSPYFANINDTRRAYNKEVDSRVAIEPSSCNASVRVFPNGASSLTIPGLARLRGGSKIVTCDIYIGPEGEVRLMRRNKLLDQNRSSPFLVSSYENSIKMLSQIENPHLLSPRVIFSNHKGMQFLTDSYPKDAFSYIEHYHWYQIDPGYVKEDEKLYITSTPIEKQVSQTIQYMIGLTKGLKALNQAGLLHNDIKPENILVDPDKAVLFDFDYATDEATGKTINSSWGAKGYSPPNKKSKDASTELYALALNFWMNSETRTEERPSFMSVFRALLNVSEKTQSDLSPKLKQLIADLKSLCERMKKAATSHTDPAVTYDDVLSSLGSMAAPFVERRASAVRMPLI